ncbi:MAG: hypothetical protein AAGA31_15225 [Bacteroidota bacterium]
MLFSYADKNTPFVLSPESLDWYLGKGWYRMGANIFTTHFLFFNNRPYSAIWIRVDLQGFTFSKSQRKLMRRNANLFELSRGPRIIDEERNTLYRKYAHEFDGRLSSSINESLEDYNGDTVFNTYETTVREKVSGKLVAASYFDLGERTAASILGFYDPDLKSFSLGYYTMLLEMAYCLEQGMRYYYPGYVVPGYERFDYKLRLSKKSQFFDLQTETWQPYDQVNIDANGPTEIQVRALNELIKHLPVRGKQTSISIYPLFEAGLYDIWNDDYVPYPYFYSLGIDSTDNMIVVAFDPKERAYLVLQCHHMAQTQLLFNANYLNTFIDDNYFTDLLAIRFILFKSSDLEDIVRACRAMSNLA